MKIPLKLILWLFLLCVGFGYSEYKQAEALTFEARDYVHEAVPKIFTDWNLMELYDRTSPEFKQATSIDGVSRIFQQGSRLGQLESSDKPRGYAKLLYNIRKGKVLSATIVTMAKFERGGAEITFSLVKRGDEWQIQGFRVNSPELSSLTTTLPATHAAPPPAPAVKQAQNEAVHVYPKIEVEASRTEPATQSAPPPARTVEQAQQEAVRLYPEIGVAGSRLNLEFVARYKRYQKENPELLRDPSWPLWLAEEAAGIMNED